MKLGSNKKARKLVAGRRKRGRQRDREIRLGATEEDAMDR